MVPCHERSVAWHCRHSPAQPMTQEWTASLCNPAAPDEEGYTQFAPTPPRELDAQPEGQHS